MHSSLVGGTMSTTGGWSNNLNKSANYGKRGTPDIKRARTTAAVTPAQTSGGSTMRTQVQVPPLDLQKAQDYQKKVLEAQEKKAAMSKTDFEKKKTIMGSSYLEPAVEVGVKSSSNNK